MFFIYGISHPARCEMQPARCEWQPAPLKCSQRAAEKWTKRQNENSERLKKG